jgi:hypothetical protein
MKGISSITQGQHGLIQGKVERTQVNMPDQCYIEGRKLLTYICLHNMKQDIGDSKKPKSMYIVELASQSVTSTEGKHG